MAAAVPTATSTGSGRIPVSSIHDHLVSSGHGRPVGAIDCTPTEAVTSFVGKTLQDAVEDWPWRDTFAALAVRVHGGRHMRTKMPPAYRPHSEWWIYSWVVFDVECHSKVRYDPAILMLHPEQASARTAMIIRAAWRMTLPKGLASCPGPLCVALGGTATQRLPPPPMQRLGAWAK